MAAGEQKDNGDDDDGDDDGLVRMLNIRVVLKCNCFEWLFIVDVFLLLLDYPQSLMSLYTANALKKFY